VPLDTKQVISETYTKPISWLGTEKLNLTLLNKLMTIDTGKVTVFIRELVVKLSFLRQVGILFFTVFQTGVWS